MSPARDTFCSFDDVFAFPLHAQAVRRFFAESGIEDQHDSVAI